MVGLSHLYTEIQCAQRIPLLMMRLPKWCFTMFQLSTVLHASSESSLFGEMIVFEFLIVNFNLQQTRLLPLSDEITPNPLLGAVFTTWYYVEHQQEVSEWGKVCGG